MDSHFDREVNWSETKVVDLILVYNDDVGYDEELLALPRYQGET